MRLSSHIRAMLQSHPTHSEMMRWLEEAEKLERRIAENEKRIATLEARLQMNLFEAEGEGCEVEGLRGKARCGTCWNPH